jgi:hypothetical protein
MMFGFDDADMSICSISPDGNDCLTLIGTAATQYGRPYSAMACSIIA